MPQSSSIGVACCFCVSHTAPMELRFCISHFL